MAQSQVIPPAIAPRSAQVPAQYYGYALQITRLLDLALDAQAGSVLSLEVFEDVGLETASGDHLASQAKSGLVKNPISDRAVDLWKTFSNWLNAVESGQLPIENTTFEIFLGRKHTGKLAAVLSSAGTSLEAEKALDDARATLWGAAPKYPKKNTLAKEVAKYANHFLDPSKGATAAAIVQRFRLEASKKDPIRDLRFKVSNKWLRPESIDLVIQHGHGWIKEQIDDLLQAGKPTMLSVDAFNQEMAAFIQRCDFRHILIAMAGRSDATSEEITAEQVRLYVRQLEIIEYADEDVIEAINHFLRASAERVAWGNAGIVHESSFDEFEEAILEFWKNAKRANRIIHKNLNDTDRGQLLLSECYNCQQKLQGLEVPSFFTPGSFHALAEDGSVGWHPEFAKLLRLEVPNVDAE